MDAILLIGIQASGKSTFYQQQFFKTHLRLNLDMLKTRRRFMILLRACLETGQRFVIDNTNITAADRTPYIEAAKNAHFRVIGYFFEPVPSRAVHWNAQRRGKERVPDVALWTSLKNLERPTLDEGFDALYTITIDDQGQFILTEVTHEL